MTRLTNATAFKVVKVKGGCAEVQQVPLFWRLKQQLQLIIDKEKVMDIWRSNSSCMLALIGSNLAITVSEELRAVLQKHQLEALGRSKGQREH